MSLRRPPSLLLYLPLLVLFFLGSFFFINTRVGTASDTVRRLALQQANDDIDVVGNALRADLLNFQQDNIAALQSRVQDMAGTTRVIQLVLNIPGEDGEIPILIAAAPSLDATDSPEAVFDSINARLAPLTRTQSNALETCSGKVPIDPGTTLGRNQKLTGIALQASPSGCWRILVAWQQGTAIDTLVRSLPLSTFGPMQQVTAAIILTAIFALALFAVMHLHFTRYVRATTPQLQQVPLSSVVGKPEEPPPAAKDSTPAPPIPVAESALGAMEMLIAAARKGLPRDTEKARLRLETIIADIEHIRHNLANGLLTEQENRLGDTPDDELEPLPPPPSVINLSQQTTRALQTLQATFEEHGIILSPAIFPDVQIHGIATQTGDMVTRLLERAAAETEAADTLIVRVWGQDGWAFLQTEGVKNASRTQDAEDDAEAEPPEEPPEKPASDADSEDSPAAEAAPEAGTEADIEDGTAPIKIHPHDYDVALQGLSHDATSMNGNLVVEVLPGETTSVRLTIYLPAAV